MSAAPHTAGGETWRFELRHGVRSLSELEPLLRPVLGEEGWRSALEADRSYPMLVPRSYLDLVERWSEQDPLLRMVLPSGREFQKGRGEQEDPLAEEAHSPLPWLVHRYPDRVLLLTTHRCAVHCRFCTRKRLVRSAGGGLGDGDLLRVVGYLEAHPEVREVILSGGDPLVLSNERLGRIVDAVAGVPTVRVLRVGTRVPAVLPQRVDEGLVRLLADNQPLYVVCHFDHPRELGEGARRALRLLADAGVPLANQTVLLAGVNDDPDVLCELFARLQELRVRPYYLHQLDFTVGTGHFRVPLDRAVAIHKEVRRRLGGLAVPSLVVDLPGGGGKVPVGQDAVVGRHRTGYVLEGPDGQRFVYPAT